MLHRFTIALTLTICTALPMGCSSAPGAGTERAAERAVVGASVETRTQTGVVTWGIDTRDETGTRTVVVNGYDASDARIVAFERSMRGGVLDAVLKLGDTVATLQIRTTESHVEMVKNSFADNEKARAVLERITNDLASRPSTSSLTSASGIHPLGGPLVGSSACLVDQCRDSLLASGEAGASTTRACSDAYGHFNGGSLQEPQKKDCKDKIGQLAETNGDVASRCYCSRPQDTVVCLLDRCHDTLASLNDGANAMSTCEKSPESEDCGWGLDKLAETHQEVVKDCFCKLSDVKQLSATWQVERELTWCGPAAARIAISVKQNPPPSQDELAKELKTDVNGTRDIGRIVDSLKTRLDSSYVALDGIAWGLIPSTFRYSAVNAIDKGLPVVVNIETKPDGDRDNFQPLGYPTNRQIQHYFTLIGYKAGGHEFLVADPASGLTPEWSKVEPTYWLSYKDIHGIAVGKGVATLPHQSPWKF